jgi:hypothetical protein
MLLDSTELKATNEQIQVRFNGSFYQPSGEQSIITIDTEINDDKSLSEEDDPDLLVDIKRVQGSVTIGEEGDGLKLSFSFDTLKKTWAISCSRIQRVEGMIFPHEVLVDLDNMVLEIHFNVYS